MIPREVFDKIAALGLNQELFIQILALLNKTVDDAVEATIGKITASYAKQFLEVVETTEKQDLCPYC